MRLGYLQICKPCKAMEVASLKVQLGELGQLGQLELQIEAEGGEGR